MNGQDEFANAQEAGNKTVPVDNILDTINLDDLRLTENGKYSVIVKECEELHSKLLQQEREGKLGNYVENPSLIGDYLGKLRLNCNQLFTYINIYIDIQSDLEMEYAKRRQAVYFEVFNSPKGSASAAEKHARETTRVDEAKIEAIKHMIAQVKNEYERYNGICMYLQSRLKEFNTERIMG